MMKIKHLGVLLGLLHAIYAVPSYNLESESYIQEEGEPSKEYKEEVQKYLQENNNGVQMAFREEQVKNEGDSESYIQEDGEPSEDFKEEVRKYLRENNGPHDQMAFREEQAEIERDNVIRQGDTIVLQTHIKERWLSCYRPKCDTPICPGAYFDSTDWNRCKGEVFQIYKPGTGKIRSGDIVGLYYPLQHGNWLRCLGNECTKETCPGRPSTQYGFATEDDWYRCYGEVYRIFAYGKRMGATLNSGDDIMLYFLYTKTWVNGEGIVDGQNHCPGSSPPRQDKFDVCSHEVFTIIKR